MAYILDGLEFLVHYLIGERMVELFFFPTWIKKIKTSSFSKSLGVF